MIIESETNLTNEESDKNDEQKLTIDDDFEKTLPEKFAEVPLEILRKYPHTKRVGNYLVGKTLGEGSFAKVKEALHTLTGEKVAMKIVDKNKAKEDGYVRKNFRREGKLLQRVNHPYIVQLYEILETENSYYLVTEVCEGGDLMDMICTKRKLSEKETKKFIKQILLAVEYLHNLGILHRDLKVENLLFDKNKNIKIIDFGLSNSIQVTHTNTGIKFQEFCVTQCGSPAYVAPELLGNKKYGPQVDIWSVGVNMYAMLTGTLPYTIEPFNIKILYKKMMKGAMNPIPNELSESCKDLMLKLLISNPDERISVKDALNHSWLCEDQLQDLKQVPCPNQINACSLDVRILKYMNTQWSYDFDNIVQSLIGNVPNNLTATYFLLKKHLQKFYSEKSFHEKFYLTELNYSKFQRIYHETIIKTKKHMNIDHTSVQQGSGRPSHETNKAVDNNANDIYFHPDLQPHDITKHDDTSKYKEANELDLVEDKKIDRNEINANHGGVKSPTNIGLPDIYSKESKTEQNNNSAELNKRADKADTSISTPRDDKSGDHVNKCEEIPMNSTSPKNADSLKSNDIHITQKIIKPTKKELIYRKEITVKKIISDACINKVKDLSKQNNRVHDCQSKIASSCFSTEVTKKYALYESTVDGKITPEKVSENTVVIRKKGISPKTLIKDLYTHTQQPKNDLHLPMISATGLVQKAENIKF